MADTAIADLKAELTALTEERAEVRGRKAKVADKLRRLRYAQALTVARATVELVATNPVAAHGLAVDDSSYDAHELLGALTIAMAPGEELGNEQEAALLWDALEAGGYIVAAQRGGRPFIQQRNAAFGG